MSTIVAGYAAKILGMSDYVSRIKLISVLKAEGPKTLSAKIKLIRKTLGMGQVEFAALAGVHKKTVGHWETGRNKKMGAAAVVKLCERLGLAVKWLEGEADSPDAYINVPPNEQEMLSMWRSLTDAGRDAIIKQMVALLENAPQKPTAYQPYINAPIIVSNNPDKDGD